MEDKILAISEKDARWLYVNYGRLPAGAWVASNEQLEEMARGMRLIKRKAPDGATSEA